jgi:hypothetical protein
VPLAVALEASGFASVDAWLAATRTDGTFGGYLEAALLAQCYDVRVEVYPTATPTASVVHVFNPRARLCLRFHFWHAHYDALFVASLA